MLNNYKYNLMKRVDQMTKEEVFDAIAGPERRIKLLRKRTIISNLVLLIAILPLAVMDDIISLRIFAGVYFGLWWLTCLFWGGCIDSILQVGNRYREILDTIMEYHSLDTEDEDWKHS